MCIHTHTHIYIYIKYLYMSTCVQYVSSYRPLVLQRIYARIFRILVHEIQRKHIFASPQCLKCALSHLCESFQKLTSMKATMCRFTLIAEDRENHRKEVRRQSSPSHCEHCFIVSFIFMKFLDTPMASRVRYDTS